MLHLIRPQYFMLFALLLTLLPGVVFAAAGKAIFVLGKVSVTHVDGKTERLKRNGEIQNGDVIITSKKGQAQIQMSDGGLIAVRPDSEFRVDNYKHKEAGEKDAAVFSLLKGGFRSITGAIGKENKEAFGVKTVVGTIGIRGTDFSARLCSADCGTTADGLYVGVMDGGVVLTNDGGSVDLDPGDYGYVSDPAVQPGYLEGAPGALLFAQSGSSTSVATTETESSVSSAATVEVASIEDTSEPAAPVASDLFTPPEEEIEEALAEQVETIALPSSGTATYAVVGGTESVSSGTLDTVATNLYVDFAQQFADAQITLSTATDKWVGTANSMDISTGSFTGDMNSVGITPLPFGSESFAGNTGTVSGDFSTTTEATIGAPDGASLAFSMTQSSTSTTITGSADLTVSTTNP